MHLKEKEKVSVQTEEAEELCVIQALSVHRSEHSCHLRFPESP